MRIGPDRLTPHVNHHYSERINPEQRKLLRGVNMKSRNYTEYYLKYIERLKSHLTPDTRQQKTLHVFMVGTATSLTNNRTDETS